MLKIHNVQNCYYNNSTLTESNYATSLMCYRQIRKKYRFLRTSCRNNLESNIKTGEGEREIRGAVNIVPRYKLIERERERQNGPEF